MQIANRSGMVAGGKPYDAEVEYLESTGTQYIDTLYSYLSPLTARVVIDTAPLVVSGVWTEQGCSGSVWNGPCAGVSSNGVITYALGNGDRNTNASYSAGVRSVFDLDAVGNRYVVTRVSDGRKLLNLSSLNKAASVNPSRPSFRLFGYVSTGGAMQCRKVRNYSAKLYDSGVLVRDMIPVRVGAVGAVYDKRGTGGMNPDGSARNDGMYYNRGTGAFVVGPDITA